MPSRIMADCGFVVFFRILLGYIFDGHKRTDILQHFLGSFLTSSSSAMASKKTNYFGKHRRR
jgi:hypothetical protein